MKRQIAGSKELIGVTRKSTRRKKKRKNLFLEQSQKGKEIIKDGGKRSGKKEIAKEIFGKTDKKRIDVKRNAENVQRRKRNENSKDKK